MGKHPTGFEIGKTYELKNGAKILVTEISTRSFDGMMKVEYMLQNEAPGMPIFGEITPNQLVHAIKGGIA